MTRIVRLDPVEPSGHRHLDMRVSASLGTELYDEIVQSVYASQQFIMQTLPDMLILTQKQFTSMIPHTREITDTTDRIFLVPDPHNLEGRSTPMCIMEVHIDRDIDIVPEVEEAMQEYEGLGVEDYTPGGSAAEDV